MTRTRHPRSPIAASGADGAPFDLATRYMAETVDVPILDPVTNMPTGMHITVGSMFSARARQAATQALKLRMVSDPQDGPTVAPASEEDDPLLAQLVAATVAWSGFVVGGVPIACTTTNVRALYVDPRTAWIRTQVQSAYLGLERFFDSAPSTATRSPHGDSD
jgi:hypothetical protein